MSSFRLVTTVTGANPTLHDLFLDDSGQLVWTGGDITDEADYARMVAQRVKCRWLQLRGEWYMDQRTGTPWYQRLLRKGANANTLRLVLTNVALNTPGIRQVDSIEVAFDAATREATVTDFQFTMDTNQQVTAAMLDEPFVVTLPELGL